MYLNVVNPWFPLRVQDDRLSHVELLPCQHQDTCPLSYIQYTSLTSPACSATAHPQLLLQKRTWIPQSKPQGMSQSSGSCGGPCNNQKEGLFFFPPVTSPPLARAALWCCIVSVPSQQWHTAHHQAVLTELHFQLHLLHDYYSAAPHSFKLELKDQLQRVLNKPTKDF